MMWCCNIRREDLAQVFGISPWRLLPKMTDGWDGVWDFARRGIAVVWSQEPREGEYLPIALVAHREERREMLAWISTYLREIRPFTAYCRLLSPEAVQTLRDVRLGPLPRGVEGALCGVILGEVLAQMKVGDQRGISVRACASTLSFALARAVAMGLPAEFLEEVVRGWTEARRATRQSARELGPQELSLPWYVIARLAGIARSNEAPDRMGEMIVTACGELKEGRDVSDEIWSELTRGLPAGVVKSRAAMLTSRESRVAALEVARNALLPEKIVAHGGNGVNSAEAFLVGYLASRAAGGSLEYLNLISEASGRGGGAAVWYALCCGLAGGDVLGFANGVGRRVLREVLRDESPAVRPTSDIGIEELSLLASAENGAVQIATESSGYVSVELFPSVVTVVRAPGSGLQRLEADKAEVPSEEPSLVPGRTVQELGELLRRAQQLHLELASTADAGRVRRGRKKKQK